ncbi:MAG: glycosyltransferase family 2 protein [Burkholderiales bacterium]
MRKQNPPEVSVCVCTYKRPALLLILLESLAKQTFPLANFEVIVVDNDQSASAQQIIMETIQRYPTLAIRYEVEPTQGIAYARNKTVALAAGELLAFIDDDEWAVSHWLSDMVKNMAKLEVDAVLGPVIPEYPARTPAWVIRGRFFERPRFTTGTFIGSEACRTGNAMIKASWVKSRQPLPFDERLAQSGGEDSDLFKWLEEQGGKFIWCDSAEVREEVPLTRQTLSFMLERGLRTSTTYWQNINRNRSKPRAFAEALLGGGIGIGFAVLGLCIFPIGFHRTVRSWVISAKGFGRMIALADIQLVGYR